MRGEETQILGMVAAAEGFAAASRLIILPGTHSKWAIVAKGRIEAFATFLTGELYAVLKEHSILGRMMPTGADAGNAATVAYARAFALAGVTAVTGPADAAARGLWHIARHAGLVH